MFSCCRANPKSSKKSKKQTDIETIAKEEQNEINQQNTDTSKNCNKNLVIPTITIENGKYIADNINDNKLYGNTDEECIKNDNNTFSENGNTTTEIIEKIHQENDTINVQPTTLETETTMVDNSRIEETNGIVILSLLFDLFVQFNTISFRYLKL